MDMRKVKSASAIVEDILTLIRGYFKKKDTLESGKLLWLASALDDVPKRGKRIKDTKMVPVVLTLVNDEDVEMLKRGVHKGIIKRIRMARMARMVKEAHQQGGLLTELDLTAILCMHNNYISKSIQAYQKEHGELLPLRGYIHDCGSATTHKVKIISLYRQGLNLWISKTLLREGKD